MHATATASTHRLKPVARPFMPRTLNERLRGRYATPDEDRAKQLLRAVAPTVHKLKRRSRAGLKAAIAILEAAPVAPHEVQAILDALPDTPHMLNARRGRMSDADLWRDAIEAADMAMHGHALAGSDTQLGKCLSVVDALLSVPEGERAAVIVGRETA